MKHSEVGIGSFFPAYEDTTKTVHPAVCAFNDPTPSFVACVVFNGLRLFAARTNMSGKAKLIQQVTYFARIIAFIHAHALRVLIGRGGPLDQDVFQCALHQLDVVPIRPLNFNGQRNTLCLGQYTTLGALLASIRRIGSDFFLTPQLGLCSTRHPSNTTTSRFP